MNTSSHRLALVGLVAAAMLLAACTAGSSPIGTDPPPGGEAASPGAGGDLTVPQPGQLDVHPIPADRLEAEVDGRAVTIRITFTSGVEPCSVLDTIVVDRGEMAFSINLREGHGPGDPVCIDIAKVKQALVDLGQLAPGTYTISDGMGGAAPIQVVVS